MNEGQKDEWAEENTYFLPLGNGHSPSIKEAREMICGQAIGGNTYNVSKFGEAIYRNYCIGTEV